MISVERTPSFHVHLQKNNAGEFSPHYMFACHGLIGKTCAAQFMILE
jgi:hypothetical protein